MNRYQFLRILEGCRYGLIVLLFQVPAWIMLGYVGYRAICVYLEHPNHFMRIFLNAGMTFIQNLPIPFIIWGAILLCVQLFVEDFLLSIKRQYFNHLGYLFIIRWYEYEEEKSKLN